MPNELNLDHYVNDEHDALLEHVADIERCVARDTAALALAQERLATSLRDLDEVRAHLLYIGEM